MSVGPGSAAPGAGPRRVPRGGGRPLRVVIVDDHAVVRRGLRAFLEVVDDVAVVGEAADGREALELLARMAALRELPDVLLLDLQMPGLDGTTTAGRVAEDFASVRVVVLTSFGENERVHAALGSGVSGFVLKDAEPGEVVSAVRSAAAGEVFLDPAVARRLTRELVSPGSGLGGLTTREREVLVLVARGRANRDIAADLVISERTARTHVSNVLRKLGLTSRTQAALVAIRQGLVPPPVHDRETP